MKDFRHKVALKKLKSVISRSPKFLNVLYLGKVYFHQNSENGQGYKLGAIFI